ncbi:MAG: hypothetical protein II743_06505 [Lachnospiraceae bacterium]|nr:hypothetical protein [Lachnospiraceae bacterium]MBQ3906407.1 hypothetical protein [Lachnospiraceae bacterium]
MRKNLAKNIIKRLSAFLAGAVILGCSTLTAQAEEKYTYCYDYWGEVQDSPDAYEVVGVYTSADLGLDKPISTTATGLTVIGNDIYLCDTGNNRIIQLSRVDREDFEVVNIFDSFKGDVEVTTFNKPQDFQINEDGNIFIADTDNNRVLKLDSEWNYLMEFNKPTDNTLDEALVFQPTKLAVDSAGRVYCIATGINKGMIKYEADGTFSGFVGATPVVYNLWDYIWKRFFSTAAQREKQASFVPTEYSNLYMDHDGFIYACSSNLAEEDLKSGSAKAVRRLNLMGSDILIQNGEFPVYGDIYMGSGGGYTGCSKIVDVTAFDNDSYVLLDKERGRLFVYDSQGRMLFAFGGKGNMDGYFSKDQPISLDHMGYDLIALDSISKTITVFTPTDYGKLVFQAMDQFDAGFYEESGETWQAVMDLNGNYDLAYIGVGRALLRQERYKEALEYFELKFDDDNYSKAFKQYRKQWIEEHILVIFIVAFAVLIVPMIIGRLGKIKREIDTADIFKF